MPVRGSRFPSRRDVQRRFWRLIRSGMLVEESAAVAGVSHRTGWRWFHDAGGMPPLSLIEPVRTRTLNVTERETILAGMHQQLSIRAIAASIDRAPSTVMRELRTNLPHQEYRTRRTWTGSYPGARVRTGWKYSPHLAQKRADARAARPKVARLADNHTLREHVQDRLREEHSPEQIAARLRVDFPEEPEMWVSHETIYQSLYVQGRGALRRDLSARLRTGRAIRRPRRRPGERRGRIVDMVSISERPAEVEDRAVPGNWEGDLIIGEGVSLTV